jgi:hypothetical protein
MTQISRFTERCVLIAQKVTGDGGEPAATVRDGGPRGRGREPQAVSRIVASGSLHHPEGNFLSAPHFT